MIAAPFQMPVDTAGELASLMRSADELMRPERLAAIQPSRVSASRALMNQAIAGRWQITRKQFSIDGHGNGIAEYRIDTGARLFSFPVYSFEPSPHGRSGRIIGRAWDMMGALVEGDLSSKDFETTRTELPKLYRGRATPGTLVWCRSNRSGRAFERARAALARGEQPPVSDLAETCYLMRNTGLDGNGTFGTRTFRALEDNHPLRWSLSAQMLGAYMMRVFAADIIEHLARVSSEGAVRMDPALARFLGVGNGSALGLMLYVNNHPRLIERWLGIREQSVAKAKLLDISRDGAELSLLLDLLDRAIRFRREDKAVYENVTPSAVIADDLVVIRRAVAERLDRLRQDGTQAPHDLRDLTQSFSRPVGAEAEETLNSLLIELVPDFADALVSTLVIDEEMSRQPEMSVADLREIVRTEYAWALKLDLDPSVPGPFVWYKSVTAEEPRRGLRSEAGDGTVNLGLDLPRLVLALDAELKTTDPKCSVARFLIKHPTHRATVTRVQALAGTAYHSVHADTMSPDFVPAHITRVLNIGVHGIDKARDFLNRNLRGVLFHGAPLPADIASGSADQHWFHPVEPEL